MTEVSFYHLQRQPLSQALPKLLERALAAGHRAVVLAGSQERVEALDNTLWVYDPDSFLPHGTARAGFAEQQPIYLTTEDDNPNQASLLVLIDGMEPADISAYARCLDLFDGNDQAAVDAARLRWKKYKDAGHQVTYWQQKPGGGWEKKG